MASEPVRYEFDSGIAVLTLDDPPMNLVALETVPALEAALDAVERDGARAVIVTGAGERAFCAGSDVSEFPGLMRPGEVVDRKLRRQNAAFDRLAALPVPTIAALGGLTYGGGLEIAVCCDLLIAERQVRLALPEIKLGIFPGSGGTFRVTRRIGQVRAKELMLLGEPVDADTALSWGLLNRVVERGAALEAAKEWAATLAQRPRNSLALCKSLINATADEPDEEMLRRSLAASDEAFTSPEAREGVRAFFAKETPDFGNGAPEHPDR
ncbi:enoyl-CoA hydratase/isomerase family protein [Saccharopolyspora gloriosae]|uniref:enoyl-CoA hydratase/isomerase family protein n=1 Tax=Saccharopolyspora gloriosae TaxID=455344 RepID=UPI001FB62734|nr:enoyl-CoA hydratase/isomerase family protein [Saccharopolyspora gloriosae]